MIKTENSNRGRRKTILLVDGLPKETISWDPP